MDPCRAYLRALSLLVPPEVRREWREEWATEIACRRETLRRQGAARSRAAVTLVADASGAFADALWHLLDEWSFEMLMHDLRSAWRAVVRKPAFHLVAILTLALGIGGVTAIYSVFDAAVLSPLPYPEPGRLAELWEENPLRGWKRNVASPANFLDWRDQAESFADVAAVESQPTELILSGAGESAKVVAYAATGNLMSVLGVPPLHGPGWRFEDTWSGAGEPSVILSYGLWQSRFGGDDAVAGETVRLNGRELRVAGVMPRGFSYPVDGIDLWVPVRWDPSDRERPWFRRAHFLRVVARLSPGATFAAAETELAALARRLEEAYPELNRQAGAGLTPLHEWILGDARPVLWLLLAAVGLVLLIACGNVVNLILARSGARTRELAIRSALGAGRRRLLRQLLTENLLVALGAGLAGYALGRAGLGRLLALSPDLPRLHEVTLDARVLAVSLVVTSGAALLSGLAPALACSRLDVDAALRRGGSALAAPRRARRRRLLVVGEVALALIIVAGAGLLAKSLYRLYQVDPGFETEHLLALRIGLPGAAYRDSQSVDGFFTALSERLAGLSGVESAAETSRMPLLERPWSGDVTIEGREAGAIQVQHLEAGPGFFRTLRIPLLAGRDFTDADRPEAPRVAVVNRTFAREYFPGEDPVGRRVTFTGAPDASSIWRAIVGVVGDVRVDGLRGEVQPLIYEPIRQNWSRVRELAVRTTDEPRAIVPRIRDLVRSLDRDVPLMRAAAMSDALDESISRERFVMLLLTVFGGVALILAAVGTYGVMAVLVHQRTREIGVRMALGADRGSVVRQVVTEGLGLVLLGCLLGLLAAVWLSRSLGSLLFEVSPADPSTLTAVALVVVAAGLAASFLPARRASRIDPMATLSSD